MKTYHIALLMVALVGTAQWIAAEPPVDQPPPPPVGEQPAPPPEGMRRRHGFGDREGTNCPGPDRHTMAGRPMIKEVEEFKARNPEEFNRLMKLRNENPEAFKKEVRERFAANMKEKHPEAFKAHETERKNHEELRSLCRQYRAATNDTEKAALEEQMRTLLTEIFDAKQQARQKELEALQNRLKELQQSVEARVAGKAQELDAQMKELTQGKMPRGNEKEKGRRPPEDGVQR